MTEQTKQTKHSPTPWRIGQTDKEDPWTLCVEDANGVEIYTIASGAAQMQQNINDAYYIVEAVNAHERLVAENARLHSELGEANEYGDLLKAENARLRDLVRRLTDAVRELLEAVDDGDYDALLSEVRTALGTEAAQ